MITNALDVVKSLAVNMMVVNVAININRGLVHDEKILQAYMVDLSLIALISLILS